MKMVYGMNPGDEHNRKTLELYELNETDRLQIGDLLGQLLSFCQMSS